MVSAALIEVLHAMNTSTVPCSPTHRSLSRAWTHPSFLDHSERLKSTAPFPSARAFTIVELLVVIGMVGVLFTIVLLPALAKSSDQGARTVCVNNLRQLGRASQMYANDNGDYFALPNWGNNFQGWLYTPVGSAPPNLTSPPYNSDPTLAYRTGLWFSYVQDRSAYLCPVDLESRYYSARANKMSSYVMNGSMIGFGSSTRPCKVTDAWSPDCFLLYQADETAGTPPIGAFAYNDGASFPDKNEGFGGKLHTRNGTELVTVSGSVRFFTAQKLVAESTSSGRSLAWWSPFSGTGR
jgi:type II secretory pathway pseudopilin PulG